MSEAATSPSRTVAEESGAAALPADTGDPAARPPRLWVREPRRVLWLIVGCQALWLLYLMSGGWYLQADLSNLSESASRSLSWDYLTKSLGGHFSLVGRFAYWILQRAAPMDYGVTIGLRLVLQAVATLLLYRLLVRLVGQRPLVLVIVGLYAFSPILGPNLTYFTPALGQTIGQVFALLMYLALLRWASGRALGWALATGAAMLLMVLGDDQMIVLSLTLPILVVGFLDQGPWGLRLVRELRQTAGWVLVALPTAAFIAAFVVGGYGASSGGTSLSWRTALELTRDVWLKAIGPLFVGGPLRWAGGPGVYVPFAAPTTAVILLGQLVFLCLVVIGVRRVGWLSLLAWVPLLLVSATGILLVGAGRYAAYGATVPLTWRYSFPVALPAALALALALSPTVFRSSAPHPDPDPESESGSTTVPKIQRYAGAVLALSVVVASGITGVQYVQAWWRNPAKNYVQTLVGSARAAGPNALLYDTPVRGDVISPLEPDHHISDLLRLMDVPARFDQATGTPLVATADGRLVAASFLPVAHAAGPEQPNCGTYVHGVGTTVIALSAPVRSGEWYLQLSLYQAQPSQVSIQIRDADGSIHDPIAGSQQTLPALASLGLRLPWMAPTSIVVTSKAPDTSLCLVQTLIGAAFPAVK